VVAAVPMNARQNLRDEFYKILLRYAQPQIVVFKVGKALIEQSDVLETRPAHERCG
jgi:hypothetical protein